MTIRNQPEFAERVATAQRYIDTYKRPTGTNVTDMGKYVSDNVVLRGIFGEAEGRAALLTYLITPNSSTFGQGHAEFLADADWSAAIPAVEISFPAEVYMSKAPGVVGDDAIIIGCHKSPRHFLLGFSFDSQGRISRIEVGGWMDAPAKTKLRIPEQVAELLSKAQDRWRQAVVAYPTADGKMHIGLRGSTHAYSDDQLAFWARGDGGSFARALADTPSQEIALLFYDPDGGAYFEFYGRARIDDTEAVRTAVFEGMNSWEQKHEFDRVGRAVIVDIDRIRGTTGTEFVAMERGPE